MTPAFHRLAAMLCSSGWSLGAFFHNGGGSVRRLLTIPGEPLRKRLIVRREAQTEQGALAGVALHLERAAEELSPLPHAGQAVAGRARLVRGRRLGPGGEGPAGARSPAGPTPAGPVWFGDADWVPGAKPLPSSSIARVIVSPWVSRRSRAVRASACLTTFCRASWAMR